MGCINSTKKRTDHRSDNMFRVRAVRLQPTELPVRNGILELNARELVFISQGREPVVWALQHLRRYGLNDDIFSFEAGRRCVSGPGIYTFRCQQAERLYQLFQRHVNAISNVADDMFNLGERNRDHPSNIFGRPDTSAHTNNYLEPVPMNGLRANLREAFSNNPLSLDLDSPIDSAPSPSFTNEIVHFPTQPSTPGTYANANANVNANPSVNANVYMDPPVRVPNEHNNNNTHNTGCSGSAFSTLSRKIIAKRSSLDMPPEECAPILNTRLSDTMHMYANVEGLGSTCFRDRDRDNMLDPTERCYENLSRLDLSLLLQPPPTTMRDVQANQEQPTPINYIVLDLDQPRSPAQSSPKICFGSGLSLAVDHLDAGHVNAEVQSLPAVPLATSTPKSEGDIIQQQHKSESSLGYSTIDFIKTCALIKSSTHCADFDPDPDHDQDESRITRHSKCVRKAYSISE